MRSAVRLNSIGEKIKKEGKNLHHRIKKLFDSASLSKADVSVEKCHATKILLDEAIKGLLHQVMR